MEDSFLDHFRDYVVEKLKPKPKSKTLPSLTSSNVEASNPATYLIYDMKDDEVVAPLEDYLFDQGFGGHVA